MPNPSSLEVSMSMGFVAKGARFGQLRVDLRRVRAQYGVDESLLVVKQLLAVLLIAIGGETTPEGDKCELLVVI
jgi:hypothetical protein